MLSSISQSLKVAKKQEKSPRFRIHEFLVLSRYHWLNFYGILFFSWKEPFWRWYSWTKEVYSLIWPRKYIFVLLKNFIKIYMPWFKNSLARLKRHTQIGWHEPRMGKCRVHIHVHVHVDIHVDRIARMTLKRRGDGIIHRHRLIG